MVEEDKNSTKISIIVITVSIVVGILLIFFVGKPLYESQQKQAREVKAKSEYLRKLEEKLSNLKTLETQKEELVKKNEKVLAAIPSYNDVGRLFLQFERVASSNGLNLKKTTQDNGSSTATTAPATQNSNDIISEVPYTADGEVADYPSLKEAIVKLQDALRMVSITKLDIKRQNDDKTNLSASITATTYVRK